MTRTKEEEIRDVLTRIEPEVQRLSEFEDFDHIVLRANPPATEAEISSYERYLGRRLPDYYRSFLRIHNGYRGIAFYGDFLSIQDVMPNSRQFTEICDWKKTTTEFGSGDVLDAIVVAEVGAPNDWVFIDPNQPTDDDECLVVSWSPDLRVSHRNLLAYLENCLEQFRKTIAAMLDEQRDKER